MIRSDASPTVKRRLRDFGICPLCNERIRDFEDFQFLTYNIRSQKCYAFFHTECLTKSKSIPLEEEVNYG